MPKQPLKYAFLFLFSLSTYVWAANPLCDQRFDYARTHGRPLQQLPWSRLHQILLIGDEHASTHPEDLIALARAYRAAKSGRTCLMLEAYYLWTPAEFLRALARGEETPIKPEFESYFQALIRKAQASQFPIYFVDHQEVSKSAPDFMNRRDAAMAYEIDRHMTSGECQNAVMIVGKSHIAPEERGRKPLRSVLKGYGFSTSTLQIIYSGTSDEWNPLCPSLGYTPSQPIFFFDRPIKSLPVFSEFSRSKFGFFDVTVLSP